MTEPDWRRLNRANWDERVAVHMAPGSDYGHHDLRDGPYRLHAIEEEELGPVDGLRLLHLQCHFGVDTLALAQRGAAVTGLDFSPAAIAAARELAASIGIDAQFVEADVYDARTAVEGLFDRVFASWGTICWLPDIAAWGRVVASLLKPGGEFYFVDMHPAAAVFDGALGPQGAIWFAPYFGGPITVDEASDYANAEARLANTCTIQFIHPVAAVVQALLDAGLRLTMLREHDRLAWKQFPDMVEAEGRLYRLPDKPWLPLSFSLKAIRPTA